MADNPGGAAFISAQYDNDIESLMTMIYAKTRIPVTGNDPLVAYYIASCFMAGRLEQSLRQVHEEHNRRMQDVITAINADANEKAVGIVNGAIEAAKSIVENAIRDSAKAVAVESENSLKAIAAARMGAENTVADVFGKVKFADAMIQKWVKTALAVSVVAAVASLGTLAAILFR